MTQGLKQRVNNICFRSIMVLHLVRTKVIGVRFVMEALLERRLFILEPFEISDIHPASSTLSTKFVIVWKGSALPPFPVATIPWPVERAAPPVWFDDIGQPRKYFTT